MTEAPAPRCPSAQADMPDARLLGVVTGAPDAPRIAYLNAALPVDAPTLALTGPLPPTRVLRFSARCESHRCTHFDGQDCQLARRIVEGLDPVVAALPACTIRRSCRWYGQEGAAACHRCPQVVTAPTPGAEGRLADVAGLPG